MRARRSVRDEAWLACALSDTDTLLQDHAHCEKKAAASALALIQRHPEASGLVAAMAELAQEELGHFAEVHARLVARGVRLGPDRGDPYARALIAQVRPGNPDALIDRLLVSALIEARSCERLRLLGEHHPDPELAEMFRRFARSEANHGHLFLKLARELGPDREAVDARLSELDALEAALVDDGPIRCAIH